MVERDAEVRADVGQLRGGGTHASKIVALREAGITVVENLSEIGDTVAKSRRPLAA